MTECTLGKLIGQMVIGIGTHKSQIGERASRQIEPKFLIMKPTPKPDGYEDLHGGKNQRRIFNRSLDKIACKYDDFYYYNVHQIRPEIEDFLCKIW